jgi:threonine dehydrogenase-like Zn-dependent dehydrogenase
VPDGVPFESAVFANLAATALHAIHRGTLGNYGPRVLVVGGGLVGQLVAQCAAVSAKDVILVDKIASRVDAARRCGVQNAFAVESGGLVDLVLKATSGKGIDVVFLCTHGEGTTLLRECMQIISRYADGNRRGVIVVVGRVSAQVDLSVEMGNVDIRYSARCGAGYRNDDYAHGRLNITAPSGEETVDQNMRECVRLVGEGKLFVEPLISSRLPLSSAASAYQMLSTQQSALGVLLEYQQSSVE